MNSDRFRALQAVGILTAAVASQAPFVSQAAEQVKKPNILFIAVDDLRSQLGCYGYADMKTPNIDRLAENGVRFERHYVSNPICIPSRAGLLTGTRSERTRQVYGKMVWPKIDGVRTMGATFGDAGYHTVSLGKIWHHISGDNKSGDRFDIQWGTSKAMDYADPQNVKLQKAGKKVALPAAEGPLDVPDEAYADGQIAARAVEELTAAAADGRPFLFMVGFHKPHLPFNAPKKYWDLYDARNPPGRPERDSLPAGAPEIAARKNHELWTYSDGFTYENPPEGEAADRLRQAYAACVSYTDAQIGKVLEALDRLGLRENTIIVLWSDHGWHLGHLGQWTKHTNYETAANSPLIISAPGFRRGVEVCSKPVETSDLFPTLLDLTGLPPLKVADGVSLRQLLEHPDSNTWNREAYHLVDRYVEQPGGGKQQMIGRAVRTERYRYIEWHQGWERNDTPVALELYDYANGAPGESRNLASDPEMKEVIQNLHGVLWDWESQSAVDGNPKKPNEK